MEYVWLPEHEDLMKEQVWECKKDLSVYGSLSDFELEQFKDHLPPASSSGTHLEFGAGLGRGAVQIAKLLPNYYHILVDRDGRTENKGIFFPAEDEYYNDFNLTISFMKANGFERHGTDFECYDSEAEGTWGAIAKFNDPISLVTSRCSLGFHVPLDRYLDRLISVSSPDVTMIFGMNRLCEDGKDYEHLFKEVIYIKGEKKEPFPHQNWLIFKGLK